MSRTEAVKDPRAQAARVKERSKLKDQRVWMEEIVMDMSEVRRLALTYFRKVHFGRIFDFAGVKGE